MSTARRSSFADFVALFLAARSDLKPKTRADYNGYLRQFDRFTGEVSLTEALTLDNASRWVGELQGRGRASAINGARALQSLAGWLAKTRHLVGPAGTSVLSGLHVPKAAIATRQPLTPSQLGEVWEALSDRPRGDRAVAYLRLLRSTGIRRDQARTLLVGDVHLNRERTGGWVVVADRSGKRQRRELDRNAAAALDSYLREMRPDVGKVRELFVTEEGRPFTENGFSTWIDRVWDDIEKRTPSGIKASSDFLRVTWNQDASEPIRDPVLRRRCEKFLRAVDDHDQAVREACVVLEDRVRERSGASDAEYGIALMDFAFAGKTPPVRLSSHPGEQAGAHQLFRGMTGFYRNGTGHRLRDDFDPGAARRIVSWVDHLLGLLEASAN